MLLQKFEASSAEDEFWTSLSLGMHEVVEAMRRYKFARFSWAEAEQAEEPEERTACTLQGSNSPNDWLHPESSTFALNRTKVTECEC